MRPPVFQTGAYTPGDRGTIRFVVMAIFQMSAVFLFMFAGYKAVHCEPCNSAVHF